MSMSTFPEAKFSKLLDLDTQERMRIMCEAVAAAKAENRRYGIPEIHWIDGCIVYELVDGTMTTEEPEILRLGRKGIRTTVPLKDDATEG